MERVLVYCADSDVKKKMIESMKLLNGYNLFLLYDYSDFNEDFTLINPQHLILESKILNYLMDNPPSLALIQSFGKLIIISNPVVPIVVPSGLSHVMLSPDFNNNELENALVPSDRLNFKNSEDLIGLHAE